MNTLGLSLILKGGCFCTRETITINGIKYIVKDRLGEGGFSTVDLIEHKGTRHKYALKRIICHSVEDQKSANDEISYYKRLKHPNIISLIDSTFKGTADIMINTTSEAFLILPYYRRGTLHDFLTLRSFSKQYLDFREILRLFNDICEAVKYLHDFKPNPIAHRDLKIGNVCLSEDLTPVLMDLGSCTTAVVQVCGAQDAQKLQDLAAERCSMTYRAPELFHVESYCVIDQRTDVWSMGCILFALCYFKSPFDFVYERGDSVNLAVISGTIVFPDDTPFNQDIHELIRFILKVNPTERPFIDDVIEQCKLLKNTIEPVA